MKLYLVLLLYCTFATSLRLASRYVKMATDYPNLEKCLKKEYASFFKPMEKSFYDDNVKFIDPLNTFSGIQNYINNVDMLAGRTTLGSILFDDASISLHNIIQLEKNKIQTRWTLQVTAKIVPGKPRAKFTGVSIYTLDTEGKILQQDDYWDSINLDRGRYKPVPLLEGLLDFFGQLQQEKGAEMAAPELPYELLRRAKRYEVRRYPATIVAETYYEQRPQGYDRLGSYASGSNVNNVKVPYLAPTLMRVIGKPGAVNSERQKFMSWPLAYEMPRSPLPPIEQFSESTIPSIKIVSKPSAIVAVCRFDVAATESNARGFTEQLRRDVIADCMAPTSAVGDGTVIVGQFDALFSLNKRRNEVWIELQNHPWLPSIS